MPRFCHNTPVRRLASPEPGSWLILDDEPHATPDPTLLLDSMEGLGARDAELDRPFHGRDFDLAAQDCVGAVMEDLIRRKIIPTIQSRI